MEPHFGPLTPQSPVIELFAQLFDHLPVGVSVHDVNNTVVYYNRALGHIDDMNPAEVVGHSTYEVFRPYDSKKRLVSQRCLETRRHFINQPLFYYTRLGKLVNAILHVFPLFNDHKLWGCICFASEYREHLLSAGSPAERNAAAEGGKYKGAHYTFADIITQNAEMMRAIEVTARSAESDSAIMIYGETGCGKEMFAQAAHNFGPRAKKPFMAVSCAAIPENLLEGLLFGTAKGAFTGAQDKPGLMEMADGGTLFLDEINSMPLGLQAKMLRAIQEQTVKRIGGVNERAVSLKIISATNNHPHRAVTEGQLRPDLLYRLGVVIVEIPPLRKRKDDLGLLTAHFIGKFNRKLGKNVAVLSPDMAVAFEKHYWAGNVRELEHVIESAMNLISPEETVLEASHFHSSLFSWETKGRAEEHHGRGRPARRPAASTPDDLAELGLYFPPRPKGPAPANQDDEDEAARLARALEEAGGNAARASRALGISPQLMHHKMKKYGLKKSVVVKID